MTKATRLLNNPCVVVGLLAVLLGCHQGFVKVEAPPLGELEPAPLIVKRSAPGPGPLSAKQPVAETPWKTRGEVRNLNEGRYLPEAAIRTDIETLLGVLDTIFVPRDEHDRNQLAYAREQGELVVGLAPYSVQNVLHSFHSLAQRLPICALPYGVVWHCYHRMTPRPEETDTAPFHLDRDEHGVVTLTVTSLDNADHPAWASLETELAATPRTGLILDLSSAWGSDPRPLLPLLARWTGRSQITPLREIRRPASMDELIENYRRRWSAESRDPAVWDALIADGSTTTQQAEPGPDAIILGVNCDSACELIARVLDTYTDAHLLGRIDEADRLGRAEPALLRLPWSHIDVYFHAHEYVLIEEIEQETGPTHRWRAPHDHAPVEELVAFERRRLHKNAVTPDGWPRRCDSFPAYHSAASLPERLHPWAFGFSYLEPGASCPDPRLTVVITAKNTPASALDRFLDTCSEPIEVSTISGERFWLRSKPTSETHGVLSQMVQSSLVDSVHVDCPPPERPTTE